MKCKEVKNLLSPYLEGELNKKERRNFEAHLKGCAICKEELSLMEAAIQSVKDLDEVAPPVNLIDAINEKLDEKSFQYHLNSIFGSIFHPFEIPVLAKSLVLASSIIVILYLVTGPGIFHNSFNLNKSSEITPPAKIDLKIVDSKVKEAELSIPRPATNIPRPGSYCIAPTKMAEITEKLGIIRSRF